MTEAAAAPQAESGPFTPLAALLISLVGIVAFSGLLVLFSYAPDLRGGQDGGGHALSKSAVGLAGVVEALRLSGEPALINRGPLPASARAGLLIVTPTSATQWKEIDALGFGGPVLVILPKWLAVPDFLHRGWVAKGPIVGNAALSSASLIRGFHLGLAKGLAPHILRGAPGGPFAGQALAVGPVDQLQSVVAKGWTPMIVDETGAVILAKAPTRPLFVLADPDLINTQGIKSLDTLGAGLAILRGLRAGDGPFIFDVRVNGFGRSRSWLKLLFAPPFLGVTLCLAAAAALAGFQAACRFGPVRRTGRAIPLGKAALVDNTAALIKLAGKAHRMGGRYGELTGDLVARSVGAPRGLGGEPLADFLDRLSVARRLPESFSALVLAARIAQTPAAAAEAALRLFAWRVAMTADPSPPIPDSPRRRDNA